jgi:type I restriction enzyme S subunit
LARRYSGGTPDKRNLAYWKDGTIPWLNSGAVNDRLIREPSTYITAEAFKNSSAKWIAEGALVMALAGQGKTKGMVAQLAIPATCNQSMAAIVAGSEIVSRFLYWWLDTNYQNIRNMAGGDLRDGLNLELLGDIPCPLPPAPEQTAIAAFLDRETAKIDALVAEQRRLIELLKEKRQAVISQAVTKGLNPDAPMEPSGVEWLGDVPAHWMVTPIGHLCDAISYGFTNPMPTTEEGPYLLTANDIGDGRVKYETARRTSYDAFLNELTEKSRPKKNDLLITKDGTLGRVALHEGQEACINQSVASLRVKPAAILPEFMAACLLAGVYQSRMIYDAGGTTIKHIYISRLAKMAVTYPSLSEQVAILAFLEDELAKFDSLVDETRRAVDLLQERRAAMIFAAVTGQIDVRGLVKSEAA